MVNGSQPLTIFAKKLYCRFFWLGSKYTAVVGRNLLPHWLYLQTMSPLHVVVIVYFDVLHLVTERNSHRRWLIMFWKISQNLLENTCPGVSMYQFNFQSMGRPGKHRGSHRRCSVKRRCSWKFSKFYRKIPVLESLFYKVVANQAYNFTKIRLRHSFFPVEFVKFLRTPIFQNIWQQMLL